MAEFGGRGQTPNRRRPTGARFGLPAGGGQPRQALGLAELGERELRLRVVGDQVPAGVLDREDGAASIS